MLKFSIVNELLLVFHIFTIFLFRPTFFNEPTKSVLKSSESIKVEDNKRLSKFKLERRKSQQKSRLCQCKKQTQGLLKEYQKALEM